MASRYFHTSRLCERVISGHHGHRDESQCATGAEQLFRLVSDDASVGDTGEGSGLPGAIAFSGMDENLGVVDDDGRPVMLEVRGVEMPDLRTRRRGEGGGG